MMLQTKFSEVSRLTEILRSNEELHLHSYVELNACLIIMLWSEVGDGALSLSVLSRYMDSLVNCKLNKLYRTTQISISANHVLTLLD